jgi:hypothetical protein
MKKNEISAKNIKTADSKETPKHDHLTVKENSNVMLFESENDLLKKTLCITSILKEAGDYPAHFEKLFGIGKDKDRNKILLTMKEIISILKKNYGIEYIKEEQVNFIIKLETCYGLFTQYTSTKSGNKIISFGWTSFPKI